MGDEIRALILQGEIDRAQALMAAEGGVVVRSMHPVMALWRAMGYDVVCRGLEGPRDGEMWYEVFIAGPGVDVRAVAAEREDAYLKAHVMASLQLEDSRGH